jgi:succinate dehydrogenase / fumarate reductase flavoprotein subunit
MYHQFKELAELDITKDPMEVGPTLHYFMGGVAVDADTQMSRVPGLFAAGEVGGGMHGANRLGGNSLSDLIVFGKLAGDGAVAYCRTLDRLPIPGTQVLSAIRRATDILNREAGENPYLVHEELQEMMQANVGIIRTRMELEAAVVELERLKDKAANVKAHGTSQYNAGWHEALDLRSLLCVSEAVTRAALTREESRGAHTREDFPGEREDWVKVNVFVAKAADGAMAVRVAERPPGPPELVAIANATLEELENA